MLYFLYLCNLLKLFIFVTNRGRYRLELSVSDLPGCCLTRGQSCNPHAQSYQNWLGEDDPEIIELGPKASQALWTFFTSYALVWATKSCLLEHGSWSAYQVQASNDWRNFTWPAATPKPKPVYTRGVVMAKEETPPGITYVLTGLERRGNPLMCK